MFISKPLAFVFQVSALALILWSFVAWSETHVIPFGKIIIAGILIWLGTRTRARVRY